MNSSLIKKHTIFFFFIIKLYWRGQFAIRLTINIPTGDNTIHSVIFRGSFDYKTSLVGNTLWLWDEIKQKEYPKDKKEHFLIWLTLIVLFFTELKQLHYQEHCLMGEEKNLLSWFLKSLRKTNVYIFPLSLWCLFYPLFYSWTLTWPSSSSKMKLPLIHKTISKRNDQPSPRCKQKIPTDCEIQGSIGMIFALIFI